MATIKSEELLQIESKELLEFTKHGGKLRRYANSFDIDGDLAGTVLMCQFLPAEAELLAIIVKTEGSLGTAKLEVGFEGDSDAYADADTFTASKIIIPKDHHCGKNPILTTSVAALPEDSQIKVDFIVTEVR